MKASQLPAYKIITSLSYDLDRLTAAVNQFVAETPGQWICVGPPFQASIAAGEHRGMAQALERKD